MKQVIEKLRFNTSASNILEITNQILDSISSFDLNSGLINLSVLHTSCSLMVQENADSTVLQDIKNFLNKIAPESRLFSQYRRFRRHAKDILRHC